MAEPITPFSITAPGYLGLNTQDAPVDLDPNFALVLNNAVIDQYGRVGARKGWVADHTTSADLGTAHIETLGELITVNGDQYILGIGAAHIFHLSGGTLTTLTYGGGGAAPSFDNMCQFVSLNGVGVFFSRTYDPIIYEPAVSTTQYRRMSERAGYTGSIPQANCAVSAFGRIWCADTTADKNTVTWCDTISPGKWTAGTAGSLNLTGVWPNGGDRIVALAAHNNFLIIFGRRQTLIYSGADDPSTMALSDTLTNVGCVSRSTVQNTGEDVIFLSDSGVRSLMRTIQEKSAPMRSISRNIQNDLQSYINVSNDNDTLDNIASGYSPVDAIYLLTAPDSNVTMCFDTRAPLQDGSFRATLWDLVPSAILYSSYRTLYFGVPGYIARYSFYSDNGVSYRLSYYTTWIDFGDPIRQSILKRIIFTLIGATNQAVVAKWGVDFQSATGSEAVQISGRDSPSEYGIAEYGIAEYSGGIVTAVVSVNPGGSGRVVQVGFEADINGYGISIQKVDIFTKNGRL